MLFNGIQCTGQPSTTKNHPVQNFSSAEVEKPCLEQCLKHYKQ